MTHQSGEVSWTDRVGLWVLVAVGVVAVLFLAGTYRRTGAASEAMRDLERAISTAEGERAALRSELETVRRALDEVKSELRARRVDGECLPGRD